MMLLPGNHKIAVACPIRSVCDHHARVFANMGRLQGQYLGTRRGVAGIPAELTHLYPLLGLISYAVARAIPRLGEHARVACFPEFDRWVQKQLPPSTSVFSSYGYAVGCFTKAKHSGGVTLLDGGNSHPRNFWSIVSEEHARWGVKVDPYPRAWYERGIHSVDLTDFVFSPSSYVTRSFIEQGFPKERVLHLPYPVDLSNFTSEDTEKSLDGPIRVVCTGGVSLRKGFPYLLEAIRLIRKERDALLMLTEGVHPSMLDLIDEYRDVPIEWFPYMGHERLGHHLKSAHVFALLSLEEGMARTALEAMACGVPVVLTPNTGTADLINPGVNGEVVPIRDPQAAAEAIVRCYELRRNRGLFQTQDLKALLSVETFERRLHDHLLTIDHLGPL